jgi:O-Antigen ligase
MNRQVFPCFLGLLVAAFLWPAEDAVAGQGLQRVLLLGGFALTLLVHALRALSVSSSAAVFRFTLADVGLVLLVAGQWISTWWVFHESGDRRAALNLSFEWFGLLLFWFVFRAAFRVRERRVQCLVVVTAVCTGIAALGIWQHHSIHATQAAWYQELRSELDQVVADQDPHDALRTEQIRAELRTNGALFEGQDRQRFEQRLLHSTEPIGTFALTNTLAGILVVAVVLVFGALLETATGRRVTSLAVKVASVTVLLTLLYCLVLTKSRSAWLGALVASGMLLLHYVHGPLRQQLGRWCIGFVAVVATVVLAGISLGALDREVILEAPRSFQYRLFYWTGTTGFLKETPVFGAGPGNFRQLYLRHKVPESSEEIRDPHNLFLDAYSSGGLVSLIGLGLFLIAVSFVAIRRSRSPAVAELSPSEHSPAGPLMGLAAGLMIDAAIRWVEGASVESIRMEHLLIPAVAFASVPALNRLISVDPRGASAAMLAIVIHLLAAGSLQFPATVLLILLCGAGTIACADRTDRRVRSGARILLSALAILVGLGCGIVWAWGVSPVQAADRAMSRAAYEQQMNANPAAATVRLLRAIELDPISTIPRQRLAQLMAYKLRLVLGDARQVPAGGPEATASAAQVSDAFSEFLNACELWRESDRRSVGVFRLRAFWVAEVGSETKDGDLLQQAVEDQIRVVECYPSSVDDWVTLAHMLVDTQSADSEILPRDAATTALELDRMNKDWGHSDRYLSDDQKIWLTETAAEIADPP